MSEQNRTAVFVHGFLGWGERDGLYAALPYWGLTAGDALAPLRAAGYDCRTASVGSLSSAWDRACELYAQLNGGRADYGVAHAESYHHARFGVAYAQPLVGAWQDKSIDLIGHSFGGATVRLFLDILDRGRPEEIEAAKAAGTVPSPFFLGGQAGCIHSVTTVAAPHNGTTLISCCGSLTGLIMMLFTGGAKTWGVSELKNEYDFKLDQFGIRREPGESVTDTLSRTLSAEFLHSGDHALRDLSIDGAAALNGQLGALPGVYYFSYPCCRTHLGLLSYCQWPDAKMTPLFTHYGFRMGRWYDQRTPGGHFVGKDWLPNDGLVNTISATYPVNEPFCLYSASAPVVPGVWNVMPVRHLDHFAVIGGVFNADRAETQNFFVELLQNIDKTYSK